MDTNEKILKNYKKIIELKDDMIVNLNKKIELMKNTQSDDIIIRKLENQDDYIKTLVKQNELLKCYVDLLKKHIGDEEYFVGDFFLNELENNEYIVFLLNKFKFYNFDRMKNYSDSNNYEFEFNTYKEFIEFNKNEFAKLPKKQNKFLLQLVSKIKNNEISIGSNTHFNIWNANVFYINQNKNICINHPR